MVTIILTILLSVGFAFAGVKDVMSGTLTLEPTIWLLLGIIVGAIGARLIKPYIEKNQKRAAIAQAIAIIADDLTTEAYLKYGSDVWKHIDELVDKLIDASGLKDSDEFTQKEVAERAIKAALVRNKKYLA